MACSKLHNDEKRTKENDSRRERRNDRRVPALLHNSVHNRNRETPQDRRQRAHADVRHMARGVAVANRLERELAVKPDEPAREPEEQLRERRVHVEVVLAHDVVRRELAEVDLVEPARGASASARRSRATVRRATHTTWSGWLIL